MATESGTVCVGEPGSLVVKLSVSAKVPALSVPMTGLLAWTTIVPLALGAMAVDVYDTTVKCAVVVTFDSESEALPVLVIVSVWLAEAAPPQVTAKESGVVA